MNGLGKYRYFYVNKKIKQIKVGQSIYILLDILIYSLNTVRLTL